jgi:hypothetical protein
MPTLERPLKEGSVHTYQEKVGLGFLDILASEVDADLDTIYAAWNGGVNTANLVDGAVTSAKLAPGAVGSAQLAAAPNGVATANLNDLAVTAPKLADGAVTHAKLGADVSGLVVADYGTPGGLGASTTGWVNLLDMRGTALRQNRRYRLLFDGFYNKAATCNLVIGLYVGGTSVVYGGLSPSSVVAPDSAFYLGDIQFLWNGGTVYIRCMITVSATAPGAENTSGLGRMVLKSGYLGTTATSEGPFAQILFDVAHAGNGVARYQATLECL